MVFYGNIKRRRKQGADYGRAVPYYCEVTVTKDHEFEVSYKIYDAKSRDLILTCE
jgi:hypothetical protein